MTPSEDRLLEVALRATRRQIALLDTELERLGNYDAEILEVLGELDDDVMPAFYSAIGSDGLVGVPIADLPLTAGIPPFGPANPNFGFIRMASDAPFVATSLVAVVQQTLFPDTEPMLLENVTPGSTMPAFGFRLFDIGANSDIVNYNKMPNGANAQLAPLDLLMGRALAGPLGDLELPETVFPKAGALRVEIYPRQSWDPSTGSTDMRVHVILCGFKIFGEG